MKALLALVALAGVAFAGPVVEVTLANKDVEAAFGSLVPQLDEPIGLTAVENNPKLGLVKGDLVRAVNGEATVSSVSRPTHGLRPDGSLMYLDVLRAGKLVVVRILIANDAVEERVDRDIYNRYLDLWRGMHQWADSAMKQVTKNGIPSGVVMELVLPPLQSGDIVRKIDGAAVKSISDALAALDQTTDHAEVTFEVERIGKTMTAKLVIDKPAAELLWTVKKKSATSYEIGKDLIDRVSQNPTVIAQGARLVPAVKDGKPVGFKLYAIRPRSLYAALGLENGDTVKSINGWGLTRLDRPMEVYSKILEAKKLTVVLDRRGKQIANTYTVK